MNTYLTCLIFRKCCNKRVFTVYLNFKVLFIYRVKWFYRVCSLCVGEFDRFGIDSDFVTSFSHIGFVASLINSVLSNLFHELMIRTM